MSEHTALCAVAARMFDLDPDECDPDYECWDDIPHAGTSTQIE